MNQQQRDRLHSLRPLPSLKPFWIPTLVFGLTLLPTEYAHSKKGRDSEEEVSAPMKKALENLAQGRALCSRHQHKAGVEKIFEAAVAIQKADASHPANKKWRPELKRCLRGWIQHLGRGCKAEEKTLKRLEQLAEIARQAEKVAEKRLAKRALGRRAMCLKMLGKKVGKRCSEEPGHETLELAKDFMKSLQSQKKGLPKGALETMEKAIAVCAVEWRKNVLIRCNAQPSVKLLKETGKLVVKSPSVEKKAARAAYSTCARAIGSYGWQLCQNRRYLKGRMLLKEAIGRYGFHGSKDDAFLGKMKTDWLAHCGQYASTFKGTAKIKTGSVTLHIELLGHVILNQKSTKKKGINMEGRLLMKPMIKKAGSPDGEVNASLAPITAFLDGRYNPETKNIVWWSTKRTGDKLTDTIQVNKAKGPAEILRDTLMWDLIRAAKLDRFWMSTLKGRVKKASFKGDLGGGRTVELTGKWEAKPLHEKKQKRQKPRNPHRPSKPEVPAEKR